MDKFFDSALEGVSSDFFILWLIVFIVVIVFIIKISPNVVKTFNALRLHVNDFENLDKRIEKNTEDIKELNKKIQRDYSRLNYIEESMNTQEVYLKDSLQESELILRSLLGVIQGLQEIGANGPTKAAEKEIQDYLLKKAHSSYSYEMHTKQQENEKAETN